MRRDKERLEDILEAIERIERYTQKGKEKFEHDELIQVWVLHHIQIIGEGAAKVSNDLQQAHSDIPWAEIVAIRNLLVHEYFGIDLDEVWSTVVEDLPSLKQEISAILEDFTE